MAYVKAHLHILSIHQLC